MPARFKKLKPVARDAAKRQPQKTDKEIKKKKSGCHFLPFKPRQIISWSSCRLRPGILTPQQALNC
jgi:hypothetical protein